MPGPSPAAPRPRPASPIVRWPRRLGRDRVPRPLPLAGEGRAGSGIDRRPWAARRIVAASRGTLPHASRPVSSPQPGQASPRWSALDSASGSLASASTWATTGVSSRWTEAGASGSSDAVCPVSTCGPSALSSRARRRPSPSGVGGNATIPGWLGSRLREDPRSSTRRQGWSSSSRAAGGSRPRDPGPLWRLDPARKRTPATQTGRTLADRHVTLAGRILVDGRRAAMAARQGHGAGPRHGGLRRRERSATVPPRRHGAAGSSAPLPSPCPGREALARGPPAGLPFLLVLPSPGATAREARPAPAKPPETIVIAPGGREPPAGAGLRPGARCVALLPRLDRRPEPVAAAIVADQEPERADAERLVRRQGDGARPRGGLRASSGRPGRSAGRARPGLGGGAGTGLPPGSGRTA